VDSHDKIIVGEVYAPRVQMFDPEGRFVRRISSGAGSRDGQLRDELFGIVVDRHDNVTVTVNNNHRIQVFHRDSGRFMLKFGSEGSGDGHLSYLKGIANNLLTLARADMPDRRLSLGEVNLSEVLEGVADIGLALAQQKNIEFEANIPPSLTARGDADKLSCLFTNLVDNAVRYTEEGGRVTMEAHVENGRVKVSVKDTGIGIEKSELPHIFDRFYRSDRARSLSSSGTGLGLSICDATAKEHGVEIDVQSRPGKGSTFVVTIPLHEE